MRKQILVTCALSIAMLFGTSNESNAQFKRLLKKVTSKKSSSKKSKSGGASGGTFSYLNNEKDDLGLSGEYHGLKDKKAFGFRFVKENEGKVVNELHYWEKKQEKPQLKMNFKESYYRKKQVKMFFVWMSSYAKSYVEVFEVAPGVLAQTQQTSRSINKYEESVPLDSKRTVIEVMAKNKADLDTWDIETAQAKVDMLISSLNTAKIAKTKKKLMRFETYKNYHGKVAFAKQTHYLKSSKANQPVEKSANFITKRELGETVAFKPYFEQPLSVSHPGAWFNITYEMAGQKTSREALRKTSTKFSKNIPQLTDYKNDFYFFYPKVTINTSNNIADYAFLELLRLTQDSLTQGKVYDLKVTVWAYKDGQNIDPVATGTIQLEYTKNTEKLLLDPVKGWITVLEDYLDE
ncbi:hypothetical protein DS884_03195 [Tenacibaculum sp. E3R01]|uniref:hypothetical protein n=1 Tax=Tenacibaculum sp. E3R01 TaxID=2267227 RepID=UPI000DE81BEB|nr:hypothetical protein [Tenacibaculum sp. E3R01]RBW61329.1 hypothetical protein DS884_03195 [Tenacibaculum sp. E3R01]